MLTELSVVDQRYLAVREALEGARITDVATRYGVDRRTVHRWRSATPPRGCCTEVDEVASPSLSPTGGEERGTS